MRKPRTSRISLSLLFILLCALWGVREQLSQLPQYRSDALTATATGGEDWDSQDFVAVWKETPHFRDTWQWWYGPWGQKRHPFYRPIPSLLFWTQYQLFSDNGKLPFHVLLLVWHFVAVLVIWRFLCAVLGNKDGTLIAGLWSSSLAEYFSLMFPGGALDAWKDNVESWHAIAHVLCLWAFWRYLQTANRRWQIAALFLFWVAICVKEMAYMAPFMMLLLAWYARKWREGLRAVWPFFGLAALMFCFRFWALGGMGYRMGSNNHWKIRLINDNLGGAFTPIINGDWLSLSMSVTIVALWYLKQRRWAKGGALFVAAVLMLIITSYWSGMGVINNAARLLMEQEIYFLFFQAVILFFWWRFLQTRNRQQIFGALWALILYAPLTSGPNTNHIYYFVAVGWSIWLFYALLDAGQLMFAYYRANKKSFTLTKG